MTKFRKLTAVLLSAVMLVCCFTVQASAAAVTELVSGKQVTLEQDGGKTATYQFTMSEDGEVSIKMKAESPWSTMDIIDKETGEVIIPMNEPGGKNGVSGVTLGFSMFDQQINSMILIWNSENDPPVFNGTFKYFLAKGTYYLKIKTLLPKEAFSAELYDEFINEGNKNESWGKYTFTVTYPVEPEITYLTVTMKKGTTLELGAVVANNTNNETVRWSSSKKKVAAVNSKGVVTAKGKGTAVITAKIGKSTVKLQIKVTA